MDPLSSMRSLLRKNEWHGLCNSTNDNKTIGPFWGYLIFSISSIIVHRSLIMAYPYSVVVQNSNSRGVLFPPPPQVFVE